MMKKSNWQYLSISALVMIALPFLAVTFVKGSAGLAVCLLLFFGVDPFMSLMIGKAAGESMKNRWFWPIANAFLFLAGVWLNFEMGEPEFLIYAGIYLLIGVLAMMIRAWIKRCVK